MDPDRHEVVGRDILAAYRRVRVPPAIRESAWERLQVAIDDDQAEPSIAEPRRSKRAGWAVALLTAAALVLVLVGLRRMAGPSGESPDHQSAQDAARTGEPARTTSRGDDESPSPFHHLNPDLTPEPPPQPAPQAPTERRRPSERPTSEATTSETPTPEAPADSTLHAELSLLRAARAALARKDAATALRLLGDHARQFPGGLLAEERMVLRAQALCEHGDRAEAREAVQQLLRAYPQSPNAATLATSCQSP